MRLTRATCVAMAAWAVGCLVGGRVYLVTNRCEVLCLDADGLADGNDGPFRDEAAFSVPEGAAPVALGPTDADILWRFDMLRDLPVFPHDASNCGILVLGEQLYVGTGNGVYDGKVVLPTAPSLIVLDKRSGELLARDDGRISADVFHGQWSSPALALHPSGPLVVYGAGDGVCHAFRPAEPGRDVLEEGWRFDCNPPGYRDRGGVKIDYWALVRGGARELDADGRLVSPSEIIGTPVVHGSRIYVAIGQDPVHGPGRGALTCIAADGQGDVTTTARVWQYLGIGRTLSTVSLADGLLYAAEHAGVTTQMGAQIHSSAEYRLGVRLLRDGAIGKVQAVHSWAGVGGNDRTRLFAPPAAAPVPQHVAWDLWIGAAPMRDYAPAYHPYAWRDWQDFGGGALGDFGCHILDPVFTALELGAPLTVKARNSGINDEVWPTQQAVDYVFPGTAHTAGDTLPVTWTDGGLKPRHSLARMPGDADLPSAGSLFIGEQGCLVLPHVGRPRLYPVERYAGFVMPEVAARDHWHDWVDACLSGGTTTAGFHHAGPLTEAVHLGNIATRLWRPGLDPVSGRLDERATVLEWDTATLRFRNSPAADRLVTKAYRPGFEVPAGPLTSRR